MDSVRLLALVTERLAAEGVEHGPLTELESPFFSRIITDHDRVFVKVSRPGAYGYPDKPQRGLAAPIYLRRHGANVIAPLLPHLLPVGDLYATVWPHQTITPFCDGDWPDAVALMADLHDVPLPATNLCDGWEGSLAESINELRVRLPATMPRHLHDDWKVFCGLSESLPETFKSREHVFLHGDAHTANMGRVNGTAALYDFENAAAGPAEWDVARFITSPFAWGGLEWPVDQMVVRYEIRTGRRLDLDLLREVALYRSLSPYLFTQSTGKPLALGMAGLQAASKVRSGEMFGDHLQRLRDLAAVSLSEGADGCAALA